MWNMPNQTELLALPRLYETESIQPRDKTIHMHFLLIVVTGISPSGVMSAW